MKRTVSLVATALVIMSLTACTTPNTTGKYNTNTNIVRLNNKTTAYRDGVYTGKSSSSMGTETAKVYIKGGRITNIVFGPIPTAQQRPTGTTARINRVTPGTTTGTTTGRTATNISGVVTPGTAVTTPGTMYSGNPGITPGTINRTTPGTVSGTTPGTISGTAPGTVSGTMPGTTSGTTPGTITRTTPGTVPGTISGTTPGTAPGTVYPVTPGTTAGTVPGTIPSTMPRTATNMPGGVITNEPSGSSVQAPMTISQIVEVRRAVANAIIRHQAYNAYVKSTNSTIVNTLQNAVKNALDQARI